MEKAAHIHKFYPTLLIHHDIVQVKVIGNNALFITKLHRFLDLSVQIFLQLFAPLESLPQGMTVHFIHNHPTFFPVVQPGKGGMTRKAG